ncbi:hypothetical protein [Labilithrix luteola]|nr:hypothetical protein [Labilithrix luteola]
MKRTTFLDVGCSVLLAVLAVLASAAVVAACASNEDTSSDTTTDASIVPDASSTGEDAADAMADASCDAATENCVTEMAPCESVAWCMVSANVSVFDVLASVWGSAPNDVWAVGSGGTILHWDGTTWTRTPSGVKNTFFRVWGSGPNDVWAVSSTDVILHGTGFQNGTASWKPAIPAVSTAAPALVQAMWGSSSTDLRLGGKAFDLLVEGEGPRKSNQFLSNEGVLGGPWKALAGTFDVTSIWGSSADDVWMTGDNSKTVQYQRGLIMHGTPAATDAGGEDRLAWTPVESQTDVVLEGIWGSSSSDVWAVGALGTIRHYLAGNSRFQEVASNTRQDLHGVWASGPNDVWAVGDEGTILHWNGQSFEMSSAQFQIGRKPTLRGVWGSGPNDVWIVGDGIALHYTGPKPGATGEHQ